MQLLQDQDRTGTMTVATRYGTDTGRSPCPITSSHGAHASAQVLLLLPGHAANKLMFGSVPTSAGLLI